LNSIIAVYTFLNDIEGGGEIYFSKLNITVPAKRGTSVFFHTARIEDGNMNTQIVHHGKPVTGSRDLWVAVKWVRACCCCSVVQHKPCGAEIFIVAYDCVNGSYVARTFEPTFRE